MIGSKTGWLGLMLLAVAVPVTAPAMASEAATVNGLRQSGWTVVERQERIERRPGLPPYESLDRDVQVTTFVLEKDGRRKRCTLAYDSQRDTITETCRDAVPLVPGSRRDR